jgi:hypothetical protein
MARLVGALLGGRQRILIVLLSVGVVLSTPAAYSQAQTVETGIVKLPDASIEDFSRGKGEPIVLLPGGTLTVSYLDGLADKSTGASTGVTLNNFADTSRKTRGGS